MRSRDTPPCSPPLRPPPSSASLVRRRGVLSTRACSSLRRPCSLSSATQKHVRASLRAGYGGKVAQALRKHGVATAVGVQALSASALQTLCELPPESAQTLLHLAHGRDDRVPAPKPPPQTISLQMTLTPVPVAMHPSWRGDGAAHAVAGSKDGMLQPLLLGGEGSHERMCALLHVMLRDLLVRVVKDRCAPASFVLRERGCLCGCLSCEGVDGLARGVAGPAARFRIATALGGVRAAKRRGDGRQACCCACARTARPARCGTGRLAFPAGARRQMTRAAWARAVRLTTRPHVAATPARHQTIIWTALRLQSFD